MIHLRLELHEVDGIATVLAQTPTGTSVQLGIEGLLHKLKAQAQESMQKEKQESTLAELGIVEAIR